MGQVGVMTLAAVASLSLVASLEMQSGDSGGSNPATERVKRGEYLVAVGGCNDCHTPWKLGERGPEPDRTRLLSGHPADVILPPAPQAASEAWVMTMSATNTAFAGPWGVSFATNLTPDAETGLGAWTEEIFINALRTGKHWGQSRAILPPMPWPNYAQMTDEDLKSVFAYLRSIPARRNAVPEPIPPGGAAPPADGASE